MHTGIIILLCSTLLIVQIILISKGVTTAEYLKKYWKGIVNPYNEGCFSNWKNFCLEDRSARNLSIEDIRHLYYETHGFETEESHRSFETNKDTHLSLELSHKVKGLLYS